MPHSPASLSCQKVLLLVWYLRGRERSDIDAAPPSLSTVCVHATFIRLAISAGQFQWGNVWPYCMVINNFSQAWALYVLMLFYVAMYDELKPLNPLRKFVTIKLVVFASFWQGLVITLLAAFGILRPVASLRTYQDTADFTGGLQDFIICIEMFFAAVGFAWSFPPRDYMTGEPPGIWQSVNTVFDFRDVMDDVGGATSSIRLARLPVRVSCIVALVPRVHSTSYAHTADTMVMF